MSEQQEPRTSDGEETTWLNETDGLGPTSTPTGIDFEGDGVEDKDKEHQGAHSDSCPDVE